VDDAPSTTRRGRYLPDHNFDIANTSLDFGSTLPAVFEAGELLGGSLRHDRIA
jgi:hypothetical protein